MSTRSVELILAHNLAEHLSCPVFLLDADGTLAYFNEPAEEVLGLAYEDTGAMAGDVWTSYLQPLDAEGNPLVAGDLPVLRAASDRRPSQHAVRLHLSDGPVKLYEATSVPLPAPEGRHLGTLILLWSDA